MTSIYVIGDSFSAGAELIDHTFPSYNKYNPKNLKEYVNWISSKEYNDELRSFGNGYNKSFGEKLRAWPTKLGEFTKSEVINASFGGSNPMMWRSVVLQNFIDFEKYDRKIDIAIIQLTEYNRVSLYHLIDNHIAYKNMGIYSVEHGTPEEKQYFKARMMLQDDVGFFYTFLLELASIKIIMQKFGVDKIEFVVSNLLSVEQINEYAKVNEVKVLLEFLEIDFNNILTLQHPEMIRLPGGHYTEESHTLFAYKLKKLLKL